MSESNNNPLFGRPVRAIDEAGQLLGRMFNIARTDAVFGAPLTQDGATVIVASELTVGMGVGFGSGEGSEGEGSGGGGGGGGYALGRPVAVVSIDAQGVRVQPIFDLTKVAIAAITALGAMAIAYRQMARVADKA